MEELTESSSDDESSLRRKDIIKRSHLKCACCGRRKKDFPDERYFRFPKDPEMSKKWVEACQVPFLMKKSVSSLNQTYRLCSQHFSDSAYRTIERHFLHSMAIPTIFPGKSHISNNDVKLDINLMTARLKQKLKCRTSAQLKNKNATSIAYPASVPLTSTFTVDSEIENISPAPVLTMLTPLSSTDCYNVPLSFGEIYSQSCKEHICIETV